MNGSCRRVVLLAGASISTLGIANLAFAETTVRPGIGHSDTTDPVDDTLVICDLAPGIPAGPCAYGVEAVGEGTVGAIVDGVETGRIEQLGTSLVGDAQLEIMNGGRAEIAARANAFAESGAAHASALIDDAIHQAATAPENVTIDILNDGNLLIEAIASAHGGDSAGGHARAAVDTAIAQWASSTDDGAASAALINHGDVEIAATAIAAGIAAGATASGAHVSAFARVKGVSQLAVARAVDTVSGTTSGGNLVTIRSDIPIGPAAVSLDNSGVIRMTADANAKATDFGLARATLTAVEQRAEGLTASADITNNGTIDLAAFGAASGSEYALAGVFANGFRQTATAVGTVARHGSTPLGGQTNLMVRLPQGDASVVLKNSGDIDITAVAHAVAMATDPDFATGVGAVAGAYVSAIRQNVVGENASALVINDGKLLAEATAVGTGDDLAAAQVNANGIQQAAIATGFSSFYAIGPTGTPVSSYYAGYAVGPAHLTVENSGSIEVGAHAEARAEGPVQVDATATGLWQAARGLEAHLRVDNSGTFDVSAHGEAMGTSANAFVVAGGFIQQGAIALDAASADIDNSGELDVSAVALAEGEGAATVIAIALGASQAAAASGQVSAHFDNSGTLSAAAAGQAEGNTVAAGGVLAIGAQQDTLGGSILLVMENSGDLTASARMNVLADADTGFAYGSGAAVALGQYASGTAVTQSLANARTVNADILVEASATGANSTAVALGFAAGVRQQAAGGQLRAYVENSGEIAAIAGVSAAAVGESGFAYASVGAIGVAQNAAGVAAKLSLNNSGTIDVEVDALASATTSHGIGVAFGRGTGVLQLNNATTAFQGLTNSGAINVEVDATATALARTATAVAAGYKAFGEGGVPMLVSVHNSGAINVAATANAEGSGKDFIGSGDFSGPFDAGSAVAAAWGLWVNKAASVTGSADPIGGTITNSGSIHVVANAAGETMTTVIGTGTTATTVTVGKSSAFATGIRVFSGVNNMTITNSGSINVDAITAGGGFAGAMGIVVLANGIVAPGPDDVLTINNSGDLIARESADGGKTWRRGLAINVAGNPDFNIPGAPNRTVVNLLGGRIYGNIAVQDGDAINVQQRETAFDGILNPACAETGSIAGPPPPPASCGVGALVINDGGTLLLQDPRYPRKSNMYDGPSYAFVETLDMRPGKGGGGTGTLALELQPGIGGIQPEGSYPQLFANTAYLDGALEIRLGSRTRLFADNYFWDNVIDANSLSGTFDGCLIGGAPGRSVLLGKLTCIYDDANNVDLSLARIRLDQVAGASRNALAVGAQLERIHGRGLEGGLARLASDLLLIEDIDEYNRVLGSLAGESYANYLQSFPSLGSRFNADAIEAPSCGITAPIATMLDCRGPTPLRLWSRFDDRGPTVGRNESGAITARGFSTIHGMDAKIGSHAIAGFSLGKIANDVPGQIAGDRMDAAGLQFGGYAAYDRGSWYAKGVASHSRFEGDSRRSVDLRRLGGTFASALGGEPDVKMWTLGLHMGRRFLLGRSAALTPHLNLDYVDARLASFTEVANEGDGAARLRLLGGQARTGFATGGVTLRTSVGGLVPEAGIGYRLRFGDRRSTINAALSGEEGNAFEIVSGAERRGAFLAGLKIAGKIGNADLRLSYEGEFSSTVTNHAGTFRIALPLDAPAGGQTLNPRRLLVQDRKE